jgi:hypothetical protein
MEKMFVLLITGNFKMYCCVTMTMLVMSMLKIVVDRICF